MFVKFNKLSFKNILSFGNNWTTVHLNNTQSTLIIGKNGSGKSSIIEALTFGLFGKPYRNINKPQLVNKTNKNNAVVEIELEAGGSSFLIRRGMKPTIFEIFKDGKLIPQDAGNLDYQDYLENNVLHMSYKTFVQIVVLGNATYTQFMELKPPQRREVVEQIMNLKIFSTMLELLKKRASEGAKEIEFCKMEIKNADDKIVFFKNNIASYLKNSANSLAEKQESLEKAKKDSETAQNALNDFTEKKDLLKQEIKELKSHIKAKEDKVIRTKSVIDVTISDINKKHKFFEEHDHCPSCEQGIEHEHKQTIVQALDNKLSEFQAAHQHISNIELNLNNKKSEVRSKEAQLAVIDNNIIKHKSDLSNFQHRIKEYTRDIQNLDKQINIQQASNNELREIIEQKKEINEKKAKLTQQQSLYKSVSVCLKDGGIKANTIKNYVPIINKIVNKYLNILDFYVNFELDENFNERIVSSSYEDFSYQSFSEGEKFRIDLSLLMAWREIAKIKNSCSCNLLFLDETLDSSLDMQGGDSVNLLIDQLGSEGTTVFVISHRDAMADRFENVMVVDKIKGFSVINEL